jgi:hypothetical protein
VIGGNNCGFNGSLSGLVRLWSIANASELDPVDCAERSRSDFLYRRQQLRELGLAFTETDLGEADLETTITDLMTGQYNDRVRIVSFNTSERWAEDASEGCRAGDYAPP